MPFRFLREKWMDGANQLKNALGVNPVELPTTLTGNTGGLGIDFGVSPAAASTFNPALNVDQNFASAMQNTGNSPFLSMDSFAGKMGPNGWTPGWGMQGLEVLSGLAGAWNGMQQLDLAKDQFAFQKQAYTKNYENQKKLTNARLEDRQKARRSFSSAHEDEESYMARNRIV